MLKNIIKNKCKSESITIVTNVKEKKVILFIQVLNNFFLKKLKYYKLKL